MTGKVTLVGAGPGDIGLLTIKGYKIIENADVVIYDRLVGKEILKIIPKDAEKIDAGKGSSNHKIHQYDINKLLLQKALMGKNVVRIKGGDCFLFGRGGEEAEFLKDNNIPFEIVPGVSSALAVPAYAGIPVTHRDFSSSVHIVTGHQKENGHLKINFKGLVMSGGTIIFLMGVSNIGFIMNGLIENGMKKDTPCAVIEYGTLLKQRKVISDISSIEKICKNKDIQAPAIIVVGEVCNLSKKLDWFDNLPLKGKNIIVTRPKNRNKEISHKLREFGAEVIEYPCIETVSVIDDILINTITEKIRQYDIIVFTSPMGVKFLFDKLFEKRIDGRIFWNKKIAVIGSATERELFGYSLFADIIPQNYNGQCLGKLLAEKAKGKKVLLLRAKDGTIELTEELRNNNIEFEDMPIYYTRYTANNINEITKKISKGCIDYITFTAPSIVKSFVSSVHCDYDKFIGLCIGEKTNAEALKYGIKTIVSKNAAIDDMISLLLSEVQKY